MLQLSDAYLRATAYVRKHGVSRTIGRLLTEVRRRTVEHREVLFWFDLSAWTPDGSVNNIQYSIDAIEDRASLPEAFRLRLGQEYPLTLVDRSLQKRFEERATLWCLRHRSEFIGYTWTIPGRTLRPYFYPLTAHDVHIFDNFIFPEYRGRRLNSVLITYILRTLKVSGFHRAYIETAEWNHAELRSLARIGFVCLGCGKRGGHQGKHVVTWWLSEKQHLEDAVGLMPAKKPPSRP